MVMDLWMHVDLVLSSSLRTDCFADTSVVFLKLNAKEKAVCWFCGREEDDDVELVGAARVWRAYWIAYYYYFFLFLTYVII